MDNSGPAYFISAPAFQNKSVWTLRIIEWLRRGFKFLLYVTYKLLLIRGLLGA